MCALNLNAAWLTFIARVTRDGFEIQRLNMLVNIVDSRLEFQVEIFNNVESFKHPAITPVEVGIRVLQKIECRIAFSWFTLCGTA